jgi:outer membrane protein assembly factor BamB
VNSSPAIVENLIYVGRRDSYLYALDKDTGKEIWKFKTGGWLFSSPKNINEMIK